MANYTRKQLKERWEKAKRRDSDPDVPVDALFCATATTIRQQYIPGVWEVRLFPRWLFKRFLDRKIFEPLDLGFYIQGVGSRVRIMSRNVLYDPDSGDTQEWGWFRWRYYFDSEEDSYVLELDYNVTSGDTKALPLVKGILDLALLESTTSIIGKFKWRSPLLQRIPLIRRIRFIKAHRLLFYFEMEKIEDQDEESTLFAYGKEIRTGYPARVIEDDENVIRWPEGCPPW